MNAQTQSGSVQNAGASTKDGSTLPLSNPCWAKLQRNNAPDPQQVDDSTKKAWNHTLALVAYIGSQAGTFVRDSLGALAILIKGNMISLETEGAVNHELEDLLFTHGLPGAQSHIGKLVVSYLQRFAYSCTDAEIAAEKFVAIRNDRIYVPVTDGAVVVAKDGIKRVKDVENSDRVLVDPLPGQKPFTFVNEQPTEGLRLFEELVIGSQTVTNPEMAWLAAMQELLFPFISPKYEGERMLVAHTGGSNSGKTGSERAYVRLHGFKEATTKITAAELQNSRFAGVLFLDNQEEHNLTPALQDGLITMASGGEKKTAVSQHGGERPILSFTTIEFAVKTELKNRSVEIKHSLAKDKMKRFSEQDHKEALHSARDQIMSAAMHVIAELLRMPKTEEDVPDGAAKFSDNYRAVCRLLRAYEKTAQKPQGWADSIIARWRQQLGGDVDIAADENLHYLVQSYLDSALLDPTKKSITIKGEELNDGTRVSGELYVTTPTALYEWAKSGVHASLMSNIQSPQVFSRRLSEANSAEVRVLREDDAPKGSALHEHLKHRAGQRLIGLLKVKRDG
jgi:hypothetical protein